MNEFKTLSRLKNGVKLQDKPPVEEPPNEPQKPPIKEPGDPSEPPPPPAEPPVKEPPNEPGKPPVKEPPPKDPNREPPQKPPIRVRQRVQAPQNGCQMTDKSVQINPPGRACRLFGLACSLSFMLPAAYYFNSRFENDFELPVLSASNGGGNNMARASRSGALRGAQVGLS
jgi:hypothetical protein